MIKKLYDKCVSWAGHKYAKPILAFESFIESSFFPIPPDVMIIPMVVAKKREFLRIAIIATIFSVLGALFGYYVICPLSINFLGNYSISAQVHNDFDLNSYIGLVRSSVLASGFIFELPILIFYLTKIGLVTPHFLKKNRKYALVGVLIIAAIITPPDVASQVIVAIPVVILYQVSIIISKIVEKKKKHRSE